MLDYITRFLVTILPISIQRYLSVIKHYLFNSYGSISYAQHAEDIVVRDIFKHTKKGFYVDIGANHPFLFSNTYLLYKRGWRGINVDPLPGGMSLFKMVRSRDINIEAGISSSVGLCQYFMFSDPLLNTFSTSTAMRYAKKKKLIGTTQVTMMPLSVLLHKHVPKGISVLSQIRFTPEEYLCRCFVI